MTYTIPSKTYQSEKELENFHRNSWVVFFFLSFPAEKRNCYGHNDVSKGQNSLKSYYEPMCYNLNEDFSIEQNTKISSKSTAYYAN